MTEAKETEFVDALSKLVQVLVYDYAPFLAAHQSVCKKVVNHTSHLSSHTRQNPHRRVGQEMACRGRRSGWRPCWLTAAGNVGAKICLQNSPVAFRYDVCEYVYMFKAI